MRRYQLSEAKWLCGKFQNVGERCPMVSRLLLFGEISRFREVSRGDKQQILPGALTRGVLREDPGTKKNPRAVAERWRNDEWELNELSWRIAELQHKPLRTLEG